MRLVRWWLRGGGSWIVLAGGVSAAVLASWIEAWIRGSRSLEVLLLAASAGVVLTSLAVRRSRMLPTAQGSARFRGRRELRGFRGREGLIVGRDGRRGKLLRYDGAGHLLTVAPTRAGKGVGAIVPNLLTVDRPVIVIDPKGENFRIAGRARSGFGPVYALDPFGVAGVRRSMSYNPLAAINLAGDRFLEDATDIAEALVADVAGEGGEGVHWNEEARALLVGLILHCVSSEPPARRHLGCVREYLTLSPEGTEALCSEMQASAAAGGLVARAANRRLRANEREAASVLTTAQRHTHFLDSPLLAAALARSDFSFREAAAACGSVFLILPPERLQAYARWLRLMVGRALVELMQDSRARKPVLVMLDESAALGRMRPVEQAFGLAAGYRVQVWVIFQDLHQLKSVYGRLADTFLSNAGIVQAFNVQDLETATWLSRVLGTRTVLLPRDLRHQAPAHWSGRSLLNPDEILSMPTARMLVLAQEGRPLWCWKPCYYADREFRGKFDAG